MTKVEDKIKAIRQFWPSLCSWSTSFTHFKDELSKLGERSTTLLMILDKSFNLCSSLILLSSEPCDIEDTIIENSLDDLDFIKEYVWEQLNIGHWKDVPLVWRSIYSYISLLKVFLLCSQEKTSTETAIKECDMGLLLGQPILDNVLSKIAFKLHLVKSPAEEVEEEESVLKCVNLYSGDSSSSPASSLLSREEPANNIKNQYPNRFYIPTESTPSIESFVQMHFNKEQPVILTNVMNHWPAMRKWNVEYFRRVAGSRTVPIEIGSKYTSEEWTQKLVTMEYFIDNYITINSNNKPSDTSSARGKIEDPMHHETMGSKSIGYLAQHQLLHQIPELMEDIQIPEYCFVGNSTYIDINAWFGPSQTISPTHYDPKHNLLCQIFGSKIIRLFPPSEWKSCLYPNDPDSLLFNTSQVDIEDPDVHTQFPLISQAKYTDVLLKPGMILYMPPKWAHYVRSLTNSLSLSFWFE